VSPVRSIVYAESPARVEIALDLPTPFFDQRAGDYNLVLLDQILKFPELQYIGWCVDWLSGVCRVV
jgi:hypothetical protein